MLADRYHHRLLRTPREVHRALRYVLLNSRRHAGAAVRSIKGAVRLDPASSGNWFDGWRRDVRIEARPNADDRRPVARARTWLLNVGWRRYGLLDPADVPG